MQPKPTRAAAQKGERNLFCTNYNDCIGVALKSNWDGFTCERCPLRKRDRAPRADAFGGRPTSTMEVF